MRRFEKISINEYEKVLKEKCDYEDIKLPVRSTKNSAGYDFISPFSFTLNPGETIKVPSGIKVTMNADEFLAILVRSSMGFKYNVRLCNQVGIIDSDYYNNPDNEGHIFFQIINMFPYDILLKKGEKIGQGIILPYYLTAETGPAAARVGGFGSTSE